MEKNKIRGSLWAKAAAMLALALSAAGIAYGVVGMVLFTELSQAGVTTETGKLREYMEKNMAENYGAYLLDQAIASGLTDHEIADPSMLQNLEGGSLDYAVRETIVMMQDGKPVQEDFWVYASGDEDPDLGSYEYSFSLPTDGCQATYCVGDWRVALSEPDMVRVQDRYLLVDPSIVGTVTVESGETPENEETQVSLGNVESDGSVQIFVSHDGSVAADEAPYDPELEQVRSIVTYTVYLKIGSGFERGKEQYFADGLRDLLPMAEEMAIFLHNYAGNYIPIFIVSMIVFLAAAVFLCLAAGWRKDGGEIVMRGIDRLPYAIYALLVALGLMCGIGAMYTIAYAMMRDFLIFRDGMLLEMICLVAMVWLAALFAMSTAVRIKRKCFWRYTLLHYLFRPVKKLGSMLFARGKSSRALVWGTGGVLAAVTFLQFVVIVATDCDLEPELLLFALYKIVEIPAVFWIVWQMEQLWQGGRRVAAGDYGQPVRTDKMLPAFKAHADHINNVSRNIAAAVEEQMKSERLKTELITNVTHDIKTPLTSIINYVDLIKKEKVEDSTLVEYVDVLDRQSARLKKLIEDLLEASKASTGNLKMKMETCDAKVMLTQLLGEYQEKVNAQALELVVDVPEKPVYIMADGRHLWRVLDNIMSNICKYAMKNTRVYITMERMPEGARLTFKNISRYQLNISSDELMERFVRGDSSRNAETEGHGLGLSIAQSLTKLMRGSLNVEIDGDLFKVVIVLSKR